MNVPTPDFLTAGERSLIGADVAALMDDTELSVAVTYRDFVSRALTPATGAYTETYSDLAIRAVRNVLSQRELALAEGLYQAGDVRFLFARSDLTITPAREDRIVHGGVTYEPRTWDTDPVGAFWNVVARRVA